MHLVSAFILFVVFNSGCSANNGLRAVPSLKFLMVVSKHGARAPTHTYPRDPYKDKSIWPDGVGQVTKVGKQQMFRVGEKLRKLYNGYLNELYEHLSVMIQSTLVERTMISAATLLAGLYPPRKHQMWHPTLQWQPVTIYPNLLDKSMLILEPEHCPRYWYEQNQSKPVDSKSDKHVVDLYKVMSVGTGINMTTWAQMYLLYNNLAFVVENDLLLPNWAQKIFLPQIVPVVSQMVLETTLKTTKMIKIISGPFLHKIVELLSKRMHNQLDIGDEVPLSLYLHVGHDITILSLLTALGLRDVEIPLSSTTLLLELHNNPALPSKHQLELLKIDGRTNNSFTPEAIEMPVCKTPCDLQTFISHAQKYVVEDWMKECFDMDSPSD